jgi:hypothetical protein
MNRRLVTGYTARPDVHGAGSDFWVAAFGLMPDAAARDKVELPKLPFPPARSSYA